MNKKMFFALIISAVFIMSAFLILAGVHTEQSVSADIAHHTPAVVPPLGPGSYTFNLTTEDNDFLWYSMPGGGGPLGGNGSMFGTWSGTPFGNGTSTSFSYVNLGGSQDFGPLTVNGNVITTEFQINSGEFTSPVSYVEEGNGHYVLSATSVSAPFTILGMNTYELLSGYLNFSGMPSYDNFTGGFLLQLQYTPLGNGPNVLMHNMPHSFITPVPPVATPPGPITPPGSQNPLKMLDNSIISSYPYTVYSSSYNSLITGFNVYTQNQNGVLYNGTYYQFASALNEIAPNAGVTYFASAESNLSAAVSDLPSYSTIVVESGVYDVVSPMILTHPLAIVSAPLPVSKQPILIAPETQTLGPGEPSSVFQIGGAYDPSFDAGIGLVGPVLISGIHFEGAGIEIPGTGASYLTIQGNTFTDLYTSAIGYHGNPGPTDSLGTHISILNNYINGTGMPVGTDDIFVGNVFNSTIMGNYIEYAGWAGIIVTGSAQGDQGYNTIYGNYVSHIPHEGIQIAFSTHDVVAYNHVYYAGEAASVKGRDAAIAVFNPNQNNLSVFGNVLEYSFEGIGFEQAGLGYSSTPMGANIYFNFNDLVHNSVDVYNGATAFLDATYNYWGSPAGPTTGDISGNVTYSPFLRAPVPMFPGPGITMLPLIPGMPPTNTFI